MWIKERGPQGWWLWWVWGWDAERMEREAIWVREQRNGRCYESSEYGTFTAGDSEDLAVAGYALKCLFINLEIKNCFGTWSALVQLLGNMWVPVTYHFLPCESQPNVKDQQSLYTVWQPVPYFSFLCLQPDVLMVTVSRLEITRDRSHLYSFSPVHDALKSLGLVTAGPLSFPYHKTHKDAGEGGEIYDKT